MTGNISECADGELRPTDVRSLGHQYVQLPDRSHPADRKQLHVLGRHVRSTSCPALKSLMLISTDRWVSSNLMRSTYIWLPLTISGTTASMPTNYVNFVVNPSTGVMTGGPSEHSYEGESASLSNGAKTVSCTGCSGSKAAGYIGGSSNGIATFNNVNSSASTKTTIRIKNEVRLEVSFTEPWLMSSLERGQFTAIRSSDSERCHADHRLPADWRWKYTGILGDSCTVELRKRQYDPVCWAEWGLGCRHR